METVLPHFYSVPCRPMMGQLGVCVRFLHAVSIHCVATAGCGVGRVSATRVMPPRRSRHDARAPCEACHGTTTCRQYLIKLISQQQAVHTTGLRGVSCSSIFKRLITGAAGTTWAACAAAAAATQRARARTDTLTTLTQTRRLPCRSTLF